MKTAGLNFADKNNIKRLMADPQGFSIEQVASLARVSVDLVRRFTSSGAAAKVQAPLGQTTHDEFGPVQGTKAWSELAPGEKMTITKKRNAAAKAAEAPIVEAPALKGLEDIINA